MRLLRFAAGQYINTGIAPGANYRIATTLRMANEFSIMPVFGSRNTAGSATTTSFNLFYLNDFDPNLSAYRPRLRADYGGAGNDSIFNIDTSNVPIGSGSLFTIEFGKKTVINGIEYTSPTNFVGNSRPIFIGSINNAGSPDSRNFYGDFSEFIIYDNNDNVVFHGVPVQQGSTEFSTTPAPSNCYWDTVSGTYKQKAGGSGVIWYEDTGDDLAVEDPSTAQGADYGLKVVAEDDQDVAYMNSKYPMFGSDISNPEPQFKTYTFTLTGFNSEPSPPYPPYVYDSNFYQGMGAVERTAQTIDTGFAGGKIKSVLIQHSGVGANNWQARARQILYNSGTGENFNTLLNPVQKNPPAYTDLIRSALYMVDGSSNDIQVIVGQQGSARWNTLGMFNGGTIERLYWDLPTVAINIDDNGMLRVKTRIPYNWMQRAYQLSGVTYRARWCDWPWYQGVTITVTVLNTPYTL